MDKKYYTTIGLEIHAELKTASKMFCGCVNNPDEEKPNVNICPVCTAHPGTLPVINKKAVEHVIRVGLALDSDIADFTEFDRKNYFYPDIPKAYQISQYKYPIVSGGELNGVKITRIHLEEDTANNKHDRGDYSLVDFNRAGVPLMELVTEPVIHSAKEAGDFGKELQLLLRYLDVSEANMEKGEMRVELNISISDDPQKLGTKVEVKNINSFRSMERAAEYEIKRMTGLLDAGEGDKIVQETRGWDESKQITFSQRSKENANDYRYFPDPDLPKLYLSKIFDIKKLKEELPESPWEFRKRLGKIIKNIGVVEVLAQDKFKQKLFEDTPTKYPEVKANYIVSSILGGTVGATSPKELGLAIDMIGGGRVSSTAGKVLIDTLIRDGGDPEKILKEKGLEQEHDENALKEIVQKVIDANPEIIKTYKGGKENALMSLVGQIMKETKGSANPAVVQKLLKELIS